MLLDIYSDYHLLVSFSQWVEISVDTFGSLSWREHVYHQLTDEIQQQAVPGARPLNFTSHKFEALSRNNDRGDGRILVPLHCACRPIYIWYAYKQLGGRSVR